RATHLCQCDVTLVTLPTQLARSVRAGLAEYFYPNITSDARRLPIAPLQRIATHAAPRPCESGIPLASLLISKRPVRARDGRLAGERKCNRHIEGESCSRYHARRERTACSHARLQPSSWHSASATGRPPSRCRRGTGRSRPVAMSTSITYTPA